MVNKKCHFIELDTHPLSFLSFNANRSLFTRKGGKKNNSVSRSQTQSQQQFVSHHSARTGLPMSPGLPGFPVIPGTPGVPGLPWKTHTKKNTITAMFMANHSTETIITMFNPCSQFPASVVVGGYSIPPHSRIHKHTSRHTRLMILGVPKLVQCM